MISCPYCGAPAPDGTELCDECGFEDETPIGNSDWFDVLNHGGSYVPPERQPLDD